MIVLLSKMAIPPMPKGTVAANFLSIRCAFECIVNAFFCCLDIFMTNNFDFTLSYILDFYSTYFGF